MTDRSLAAIGLWGALLTVGVVAASVVLRLGTSIDPGGNATSTLAPAAESAVRSFHRIAASLVALLAIAAGWVTFRRRMSDRAAWWIALAVLGLTIFLSAIGLRTAGYRIPWITAANVAGGLALACAYWMLRAHALLEGSRRNADGVFLARVALAALIAQAATGALASHFAMHAERGLDPLHVILGPLVAAIATGAAARATGRAPLATAFVAASAVALLFAGIALAAAEGRTFWLAGAHAVIAAILSLGLARLSTPVSSVLVRPAPAI